MTLRNDKLEIRKMAAQGALRHLARIEVELKHLRSHINTTTGLASGKSALERIDKMTVSLRKNVSKELGRIEARMQKSFLVEPLSEGED